MGGRMECNCEYCQVVKAYYGLGSVGLAWPGCVFFGAEAERLTATQILAKQGKSPLPQPLAIPAGAQARLNAQVKKLERKFRSVVDGFPGAYDTFKVPYITYMWGLDVWAEENYGNFGTFTNITNKQCDDLIAKFVNEFEVLSDAYDASNGFNNTEMARGQIVWRRRPEFSLDIGENGNGRLKLSTRLHF